MLTKTKPLTDEQLNSMRSSAPLLVERYRQLRDHKVTEAAVMIEANKSLTLARQEIEKLQGKIKTLELELAEQKLDIKKKASQIALTQPYAPDTNVGLRQQWVKERIAERILELE